MNGIKQSLKHGMLYYVSSPLYYKNKYLQN